MGKKSRPLTESTFYVMIAFLYENHGYGIKKFLEEKTHGEINLGPGTLYGIINSLDKNGYITSTADTRYVKRNCYVLSEKGKNILTSEFIRIKMLYDFGKKYIN
ncbi:MAG: PadR family transcriptional regulator [Clostridium sp.]|jgi:DNA-binding PadR family transcriptional regulator|uniref:PadR family transcriptional regulator n=1 Tax=Clostridium sp. TaxID=1506 RepID=UPI0025BABF24|nr:PadR family transcriptional regulator [Clostridium sp.]MCH3962732.1 PadR family transcriptional regulator [Clostridium sp.]MCI1715853.1 PadR family transcriptional regulator [Clostridium sp.]MCI1799942.1 PadR family transcriptional regulator [Clostridium sp.]MCI1813856.1 PadR family transcriptional regulator [Clostridium sp.]MCI1870754.1 PadR family transcriptional regulator [Clostridium sp.]